MDERAKQDTLQRAPETGNHAPATSARTPSRQPVQAKLSVGPAGDKYEQEADRVAAAVVRDIRRQPADDPSVGEVVPGTAQRRSIPTAPKVSRIQAKSEATTIGLQGGEADTQLESRIKSARGGGKGLDAPIKRSMEQSFGADFSAVRVHDNAQANELNNRIQAKAFTTGSDVFFRSGEYNPATSSGQELLAHELTHVVQQGGAGEARDGRVRRTTVAPARSISRQPDDTVQRKAVPGLNSLARPTGTWTDTGDGVFGFDTPSNADDVVALVNAIRAATSDSPMRIKVLTGIHGSEPGGGYAGGHMVGTDTVDPALFLAEDREEEGHAGVGGWTNVLNVRNKTKDTITNWMDASSSVVVLAWCYSSSTVAIWDHISADWEDGTKGTGFEAW